MRFRAFRVDWNTFFFENFREHEAWNARERSEQDVSVLVWLIVAKFHEISFSAIILFFRICVCCEKLWPLRSALVVYCFSLFWWDVDSRSSVNKDDLTWTLTRVNSTYSITIERIAWASTWQEAYERIERVLTRRLVSLISRTSAASVGASYLYRYRFTFNMVGFMFLLACVCPNAIRTLLRSWQSPKHSTAAPSPSITVTACFCNTEKKQNLQFYLIIGGNYNVQN